MYYFFTKPRDEQIFGKYDYQRLIHVGDIVQRSKCMEKIIRDVFMCIVDMKYVFATAEVRFYAAWYVRLGFYGKSKANKYEKYVTLSACNAITYQLDDFGTICYEFSEN